MIIYEFNNFYVLITDHDEYIEEFLIDKNTLDFIEYISDTNNNSIKLLQCIYSFYQMVDLLYFNKHILAKTKLEDVISHVIRTVEGINE